MLNKLMRTNRYLLALILLLSAAACTDEEYVLTDNGTNGSTFTRATGETSALTQDETTGYWKASRRVPLVGAGRIVDNYSDALVSVAGWKENIANLIDEDIDNSTSFSGVANVQLFANQIASVRDINRIYAGGQEAGFVYRTSTNGVLALNVLKKFWIKTFLRGVEQETVGGNEEVETLQLNLISAGNNEGKQALSISASLNKPFDEVRIGMSGVTADVIKSLELFYAFVGENEVQKCITSNPYFSGVSIHDGDGGSWTSVKLLTTAKQLIDSNESNGVTISTLGSLLGGLFGGFWATVDFGKTVPAGSEVGFIMTSGNLLSIDIGNTMTLTTYDENDNKQEELAVGSVLGVSAIGGGRSAVSLVTNKPCSQIKIYIFKIAVNLGATVINYAFVRDPIEVDASSYLSVPDITIHGNSYYLAKPQTGNVEYAVVSAPEGSNPKVNGVDAFGRTKITGMTKNGNYKVLATYTTGSGEVFTQTFTLTREVTAAGSECNQVITDTRDGATAYVPEGGGSLITIDNRTDIENVVSSSTEDYVTYTSVASIAANIGIAGVQLGTGKTIQPVNGKNRVGFTIQTNTNILGANALKFMRVRLKKDGVYLDGGSVADENNAVSAGLIGNSGVKTRLSITTDKEFDALELWTSGVLNINTNSFRIYNAFWEPESETCTSTALNACLELMTPSNYGLAINYDETQTAGLTSVGSSFNNMGNMLDGSIETAAELTQTQVAGGMTVAVKFNALPRGQQIGFILKAVAGLADVDLIKITILKFFSNGAEVASTSSGGVLGLDVIGYGDYQYISAITQHDQVDEMRVTFAGVASALKNILVSGVFIRPDTDGDGFPDCSEEKEPGGNQIVSAKADPEDICEGDPITIALTGDALPEGTYTLVFTEVANHLTVPGQTVTLSNKKLVMNALPVGEYYIHVQSDQDANSYYNGVHLTLHPDETTWKANAASTDWNNWANWTNGTPWKCTNVIISAEANRYPILTNTGNYCYNIHFEPGAEVVNTQYLTYTKAWVEMALTPGRYYMLSAPLKQTVTGDFFIPAEMNGKQNNAYFTSLNPTSSPENRFSPRIFQRLWSSTAPGKTINGGTLSDVAVQPNTTLWTPPFNALAQSYTAGMGFSLMANNERLANAVLTFRFPKEQTEYTYFNASGTSTGLKEPIARTTNLKGRFIHEGNDNKGQGNLTVTVSNLTDGNTFLVGNPYMAHLNIQTFLAENTNVRAIKVYDGNQYNSLIKADGQLLTNGDEFTHIAPMQSFFVTTHTAANTLTVNFTEAMQEQRPGKGGALTRTRAVTSNPHLHITAQTGSHRAQCVISLSASAHAAYRADEDVELLLDNELPPTIAVFSEADGKALDIQRLNNAASIPLGFSLNSKAQVTLTLEHTGNDWRNWVLVDRQTGKSYSLATTSVTVNAGMMTSEVGRFYLKKK